MREILFKAKRLNGEWVEGYYVKGKDEAGETEHYIANAKNKWVKLLLIAPETLCQYTGTNDRNGNKIWENDIVQDEKHEEYVGVVQYGKYAKCDCDQHETFVGFYTDWKWESDLLRKDLGFWEDKVKVIGNVFDNPELVEGEK